MESLTFKRRELINDRLRFLFLIFSLVSIFLVFFFVLEDIKISLDSTHPVKTLSEEDFFYSIKEVFSAFLHPLSIIALSIWAGLFCVFSFTLKKRLKPVFQMFFFMSVFLIFIFYSWTIIISLASSSSNTFLVKIFLSLRHSPLSKTLILLAWGIFSIFLAFTYINTKFQGVFSRMDYLFISISKGNWDANMFFREGDDFGFISKTFKNLKNNYVNYLSQSDEILINIKDRLNFQEFSPELKKEILDSLEHPVPPINTK